MDNVWTVNDHYPTEAFGTMLAKLIRHFAEQTNTPEKLTGPVVLATICASVQPHVDVRTPYGINVPTSENVMIVAGPAFKKTSARERVMKGLLEEEELADSESTKLPIVLENASEGGILDNFKHGARSIFFAHDDAKKFLSRVDIQASCKRFDGTPLRHTTREDHHLLLTGRRTSMCLFIQDHGLDKIMTSKGDDLLNYGYFSRTLMSFASEQAKENNSFTPRTTFNVSDEESWFHERVRSLRIAYRTSLDEKNDQRQLLTLSRKAERPVVWFYALFGLLGAGLGRCAIFRRTCWRTYRTHQCGIAMVPKAPDRHRTVGAAFDYSNYRMAPARSKTMVWQPAARDCDGTVCMSFMNFYVSAPK